MSGNGQDVDTIRLTWFTAADGDCEHCGGWLPDHEWADLDPAGTVVDCSGQAR